MKVAFVAILGRPNAGKSTFINAVLSKKISIVSNKAQTTRDDIAGILNEKGKQIVFIDTPGICLGKEGLTKYMRAASFSPSKDAEVVLYLIDASKPIDEDIKILKDLKPAGKIIVVLNKIDLCKYEEVQPKLAQLKEEGFPVLEATFLKGYGLKEIKEAIEPYLVEGEPFYPEDSFTDKDKSYQAKEIIRSELLHFLNQEVPHTSAVKIESLVYEDRGYKIEATIIVDKPNHKGIVIGKGGEMIKKISMSARHELERMWQAHITSLTIDVDCCPGWRNDLAKLAEFGYGDE